MSEENNNVAAAVDAAVVNNEAATQDKQEAVDAAVVESDWRKDIAGDDEKFYKYLGRFNTAKDVAKSSFDFRQKLSNGELKVNTPMPDDPEKISEWRESNGIPNDYTAYKLPDGVVIGEDDKPVIDEFLKYMHESNVPDGIPAKAIEWYLKADEMRAQKAAEEDKLYKQQIDEMMRDEFGKEYKAVKNATESFVVEHFGKEVAESLLQSSPAVVRGLAKLAREINPFNTIVPNSSNPAQSIQDELDALKKEMRTSDNWAKNIKGQQRFVELTAALNRFK